MAGRGAPIRLPVRFASSRTLHGVLPGRLRLGCSALALLAGLAAFGTMAEPARADGAKIVGMRLVRGDSSGAASSSGGGGNGGSSNSVVANALARAASAGGGRKLFDGMQLRQVDVGARNPVVDATRKLMTIEQLQPKAIISWNRFNIAGGETVRFDQHGNKDWAVLNKIGQLDPSRIDGALKADGHVYLINQNGVIFGKGAQVNVRNLVASSLNISNDRFMRGILENQPEATAVLRPSDFQAVDDAGNAYTPGAIRIERGGVIQGPENGSVILLGGSVVNEGTIRVPTGQVVLAAGRTVALVNPADKAPPNETGDPSKLQDDEGKIRGVLVRVDASVDGGSASGPEARVINAGVIETPRGNITIAANQVNQMGRLSATTSVRASGSILIRDAADVTFSRGSVTEILPEDSADTITDAEVFQHSFIGVTGDVTSTGTNVTLEQGALIQAPSGDVKIQPGKGRFYMDWFSRIDVSGTTSTEVAMERNQVSIKLGQNELNSPLQRNGFLYKKTINVDVRDGSPIGNIDGFLKSIGRTAAERSATGGTVSIASSEGNGVGEVVIRQGATIDVSGGRVTYRGGWLDITQLVGADGRVYDISQASPDIQYVDFAEHRYAQQHVYGAQYEAGYTDGMDAGSVSITTGAAVIEGRIVGQTTPGARQRTADQLPALGSLNLAFTRSVDVAFQAGSSRLPGGFEPGTALADDLRDRLVLDPSVVGAAGVDKITVVTAGGDVAVPRGVALRTAPGGSVNLLAGNHVGANVGIYGTNPEAYGDILVEGSIETPSGSIGLSGRTITLATGARLTARGQWVNDTVDAQGNPLRNGAGAAGAALPDGGSISLSALKELTLAGGSVIDVSAGGWVAADGSLTKGNGGSVSLASSRFADPTNPASTPYAIRPSEGRILLGGDILGYGLGHGGSLTIRTDRIWIGGGLAPQGALVLDPGFLSRGGFSDVTLQGYRGVTVAQNTVVTPTAQTLQLNPGYLTRASGGDVFGFAQLQVLSEDLRPAGSLTLIARSADLAADDYAPDATDQNGNPFNYETGEGNVVFGAGSVVRMGMGGSVTAVAARTVRVDGTIETPAGQISLSGGVTADNQSFKRPDFGTDLGAAYDPEAGVRIGATGRLLARGAVKLDVTTDGTRRGTVLDGGSISLAAYNGAVIVEPGSLLDVSGVSTDIDIRSMTMYGLRYRSQTIASNGGTIRLTGSEGLFVDGTLLGRGGGAGAAGGTLITELLNRPQQTPNRGGLPFDLVRILNIGQSGLSGAGGYDAATLRTLAGQGYVAADTVMGGGFGSWVMSSDNVVNFNGDVRVKLDREIQVNAFTLAATPAVPGEGSLVRLEAPRVAFTNSGNTGRESGGGAGGLATWTSGALATAITGPAPRLEVFADLIDFRDSQFRLGGTYKATDQDPVTFEQISRTRDFGGFGEAMFQSSGDIRFTGTSSGTGSLDSAGDVVFIAAQLYPTTASNYTIRALGTVTVQPNGKADAPFSIGGQLTIQAPKVVQNGTIRAPLGRIVLGRDGGDLILGRGSLTSVSAAGMIVPYGYVQSGSLWFDPTSKQIETPPAKEVRLRGSTVDVEDGAAIDVRGGGDLLASEFVPGLGGPSDILADPNSFAIIPGYDGYAPLDTYMTGTPGVIGGIIPATQDFGLDAPIVRGTAQASGTYLNQGTSTTLRVGDSIYLSGGGGLPAGTYVLLPARYALMPGAYRVRAFDGSLDRLPSLNGRAPDGSAFVSGRRSVQNTAISDARWTGFQIESGDLVRQRAQYDDYQANSFFRSDAFLNRQKTDGRIAAPAVLPIDGGTLVANATQTLTLNGTAEFAPAQGGRLGRFDVAAAKVAVVSAGTDTQDLAADGYLLLQAEQLNDFGVGSLMIGGERSVLAPTAADPRGGTQVSVSASDVVVRNEGTPLEGEEILLAASNAVTVESGSVIRTTGADAGQSSTLRLDGDGALLRLSTGDRVDVVRDTPTGSGGTLTIEEGAAILASGSLALDSTGDTILASTQISGGRAIDAAARQISFGDAPDGTGGLVFRDGTLGVLAQTETLTLHGYNGIDFYGDVTIGTGQGEALQTLSLDSPVLTGHGGTVAINAGAVRLRNTGAAFNRDVAVAGGSLTINATTRLGADGKPVAGTGRIELADGPVRIAGFGGVTLAADERIVGTSGIGTATDLATGSGTDTRPNRLKVDGALTLTAAALSAGAGADNAIAAGGALSFTGRAVPNLPGFDEIGGRLRLSGTAVTLAGRVEVRAGILEAAATGNVVIADGATIDATGVAQKFFDQTRYAPGGTVKLSSAQGDVTLAGSARIALGGAAGVTEGDPGGDAGRLIVDAAHGRFLADGTIDAHSADGTRQGQVDLDVGGLATSFDTLAGKLTAAGFAEAQRMRIRGGDVAIGAGTEIRAREFALSVDGGNLDIGGVINASGATGGDIRLAAGGMLTLEAGAKLDASGAAADAAGKGGSVLLAAGDGGRLDLRSGSTISVGAGGDTGTVHLRAPRTNGDSDVAIGAPSAQDGGVAGLVQGARQITVEAYKVYSDVSVIDGTIIKADVDDFAAKNAAGTIEGRLGAGVTAVAGVELRSDGDMTLESDLDLYTLLRTGDGERLAPGVLTLRAAGDLVLLGNLSDGFATLTDKDGNPISDPNSGLPVTAPQDVDSWSYRLVGGADTAGADPLALRATTDLTPYDLSDPRYDPEHPERLKGNVLVDTVAADRSLFVRTGTGDIDIAAAADVVLGARTNTNLDFDLGILYRSAMVYTGGRPIGAGEQPGFTPQAHAVYPTGGGDISIAAGGSLYGVPEDQLITAYVQKQGDSEGNTGVPTSWWINFDNFKQGVGALGGGNVSLRAGGDISNLSAVIPTVGWVSGDATTGTVNIRNGGSLRVDALGDIISGVYYVGRGDATIDSGGAIKGGASVIAMDTFAPSAPRTILAVGDAPFRLRSRGDLAIETALDPMLVDGNVGFFSPGGKGSVSLASIGGDVLFGNDANVLNGLLHTLNASVGVLYPSTLRTVAFSGDITVDGGMVLASSDRGTLELLAADDVLFRRRGDDDGLRSYFFESLGMADVDPQFEPTPLNPVNPIAPGGVPTIEQQQFLETHLLVGLTQDQAARHIGDHDPVRIYAGGDIRQSQVIAGISYGVISAKSLAMRAGGDIANLMINARNVNDDDVTVIEAGGDIDLTAARAGTYPSVFDPGQLTPRGGDGILVGGPGRLSVVAGGNIDLGYGYGIVTLGNLGASVLPEQGADISVLAGLGSGPQDRVGFLAHYLDPAATLPDYLLGGGGSLYTEQMIAYVEQVKGLTGLDAATAYALLKTLSPDQQDPLIQDILFAELRASGREAGDPASPRFNATDRGYAAADALFSGDGYAGGITMRSSQIKTARGGDVSILVPGGSIVLGTTSQEIGSGRTQKPPSDSGLWTVLGGAIRVFAQDDILLRSSRALTASGGDILMWSSFGDIDAGIGSRGAIATAPQLVRLSLNGTLQVEPGGIISGSGIGALQPPGDVDLYAPQGIVNAGEAGIRVAGNFSVFAVQVLNADNIQVGGNAVGLPTAPVNPASMAGVSDAAAAATRAIEQSVRDQAEKGAQPSDEAPPLLITGAFLGYDQG